MERDEKIIKEVVEDIFPILNEKQRRLLAGSLAKGCGYGGQKLVSRISGLSLPTLCKLWRNWKSRKWRRDPRYAKKAEDEKAPLKRIPNCWDI